VREPLDVDEVSKQPAGEVDQMHALIDELTAACNSRIRPPFPLVSKASAMAIATAHEHQLSKRAIVEELSCLLQRRMVAMIESDADLRRSAANGLDHFIDLADGTRCRFFNEDVLARLDRPARNRGQRVVGRGDDD